MSDKKFAVISTRKETKEKVENINAVVHIEVTNDPNKITREVEKGVNLVQAKKDAKEERVRKYRREASRMASLANKRLERLERNGFKDSPAYQGYIASGGGKFGVKGKTYNEVQAEVARMRNFINANTSTIKGINTYLKGIAVNTGIKYKNMADLHVKAGKFFELSNKVEQYLRTVEDMASAIGYQKIWQAVNVYTRKAKIDLGNANVDIDKMIKDISDALTEHQKPENVTIDKAQFDTDKGFSSSTWFKLEKD